MKRIANIGMRFVTMIQISPDRSVAFFEVVGANECITLRLPADSDLEYNEEYRLLILKED